MLYSSRKLAFEAVKIITLTVKDMSGTAIDNGKLSIINKKDYGMAMVDSEKTSQKRNHIKRLNCLRRFGGLRFYTDSPVFLYHRGDAGKMLPCLEPNTKARVQQISKNLSSHPDHNHSAPKIPLSAAV